MSQTPDSGMKNHEQAHGNKGFGTARLACHCGKTFARKQHLLRHQVIHDSVGFVCSICQRRFNRKDALRRHLALHDVGHPRLSCDACRANKTKCSGGPQCLLCARRRIQCTFRGGLGASTSDMDASMSENNENSNNNESASPSSSVLGAAGRLLPSAMEFLQSLTNVSKPAPTGESQSLGPAMEAIYELLVADKPSLEEALQEPHGLQEWIPKGLETYFESFHLRWPILNAPPFDIGTESLPLAAAVCLIGAWFQNAAEGVERFYVLTVHDLLLQRLLQKLMDYESMFGGQQAWPLELFRAVLLTLIFSLYRTDKRALSKVKLLRSTFITILRELGAFDAETLADHLETYFGGSYVPYTLSMHEQFKRLLVSTYQFDTYFALTHTTPPILHRQEMGVELPSSFALWNTYNVDLLIQRMTEEPPGRIRFQVCEMTNLPGSFTSSQLLVEDVQLGLCGLLQAIWVVGQSCPSKKTRELDISNNAQRTLLVEMLDGWKLELDKINELVGAIDITNGASNFLLAYRGTDDSVTASLERISALVNDAMILYCYLKLHHHAGPNASDVDGSPAETWRTSKDRREALVCALQILTIAESIGPSAASLNPLIRRALAVGANVTRAAISGRKCECRVATKKGQHAANKHVQQWAEIGWPIRINGTPVCVCKLWFWTGRFERVTNDQKITLE